MLNEYATYDTATGYPAMNQLLGALGTATTNRGAGACLTATLDGYIPTEGTHQAVAGISQVWFNCVSKYTLDANTTALFRHSAGTVIGAVTRIDTTPLP